MSDYTPSTDEVRERFSLVVTSGLYEPSTLRPAVKYRKQFDRWLAEHDATVRADHEKAVRERIAQDIEEGRLVGYGSQEYIDGCRHATDRAARIVREGA